jgi:hypothetical protein
VTIFLELNFVGFVETVIRICDDMMVNKFFLLLTILTGCHAANQKPTESNLKLLVSDSLPTPRYLRKEQIYSGAVDSPPELYRYLNKHLKSATKDSICKTQNDLCLVLTASLKNGKIDSVGFVMGFIFDRNGKGTGHVEQFDELTLLLNNFRKPSMPSKSTPKKDEALILDFGKFCK